MSTVAQYIADSPQDLQATLEHLRRKITSHLPGADEQIGSSGFPVYTVNDQWIAGFAWRVKGPMLYIMAPGVLDENEGELGALRSGRSCVEWRAGKTMSMEELDVLADRMLADAARRAGA